VIRGFRGESNLIFGSRRIWGTENMSDKAVNWAMLTNKVAISVLRQQAPVEFANVFSPLRDAGRVDRLESLGLQGFLPGGTGTDRDGDGEFRYCPTAGLSFSGGRAGSFRPAGAKGRGGPRSSHPAGAGEAGATRTSDGEPRPAGKNWPTISDKSGDLFPASPA
jgi:hypothetical protein